MSNNLGKRICVIIPIYKQQFNKEEEKAVKLNLEKLQGMETVFVAPDGIEEQYYRIKFPNVNMVYFPKHFFKGTAGYNKLMLSTKFYQTFEQYKYICICQPDVLILKNQDALEKMMDLGYDYIGAPWRPGVRCCIWDRRFDIFKKTVIINRKIREIRHKIFKTYVLVVGNGGLSLRNVQACKRLLEKYKIYKFIWRENEDKFFACIGEYIDKEFKVADEASASRFALEHVAKEAIDSGNIPFGIHAYEKYYPNVMKEHPELWY